MTVERKPLEDPVVRHDAYLHDMATSLRTLVDLARQETTVSSPTPIREPAAAFDPSDHTAKQVNDYLADADDTETDRVLAAERAGKDRKSVKDPR